MLICSIGLAGVAGEDLVEQVAHPQDLPGLDLDVGGLAAAAAPRLVEQHPGVRAGRGACPACPQASSTAAADAAWPKQIVVMSGLTYCIVS